MKTITMIMALAMSFPAMAQGNKPVTDTIQVAGACNMCKQRIESAAYGKGVRRADWDKESGKLILVYRPDRTSLKEIEDRIIRSGHQSGNRPADPQAYEALPACCQYKSIEVH